MASPSNENRPSGVTNPLVGRPKRMADLVRMKTRDCALLYPGKPTMMIGGAKLNIVEAQTNHERHRTQFIEASFDKTRPHLAIRIWFPYVSDTLESVAVRHNTGQLHTNLHVDIKLYHDTWTTSARELTDQERAAVGEPRSGRDMVLVITMKEGHKSDLEVGMKGPFSPNDRAVLYDNAPFEGVKTLSGIASQKVFHVYLADHHFRDRAILDFAGAFQNISIN